jgi:hypothetical protein
MNHELCATQHTGKYHDPNPYINHLNVQTWTGDQLPPNPAYRFDPANANGYCLVNGRYQPSLTGMQPGAFKVFKLVAASVSAFLELAFVPHTSNASFKGAAGGVGADAGINGANGNSVCDVYVLAKDGIWVDARCAFFYRNLHSRMPLSFHTFAPLEARAGV